MGIGKAAACGGSHCFSPWSDAMKNRLFLPLVVLTLLLAAGSAARADLVVNGGFETGNFSGWTQSGNVTFTSVQGAGTFPGPHSGNFFASLGPVGSLGFLDQNLATTAGTTYHLSYWLESDGGTPNEFQVQLNGVVVQDMTNIPASPGGKYEEHTLDFTATSASTNLKLGFRDDPGFFGLDDISVNAVPEPATLALAGSGLLTLLAYGWRRRRARQANA
jgi:hypothetical protein